ncbi:DUF3179 domain-containing protein [Salinimicrobium sp. CDJ15-81-2]|nr:DUF3179 domain-containing protein [Salinimicrobium nanhaiense]
MKGFNLENALIPVEEIKDGGPPKDGIPSIDKPKFLRAQNADLGTQDRILGVYENGVAKAYPIKTLNYHEIVNDEFDGKPVVITYCPLCGSGIAFDDRIKGKAHTFGVSGLLYNSDVLLYDRETESLWSQLKYEAVSGPLRGTQLEMLNTSNTTWAAWKQQHPNTLVLSEDTGFKRNYSLDPYPDYQNSSAVFFPVANESSEFHPKEMVIGIEMNGVNKAYPFSELEKTKKSVITDMVNGQQLKINYSAKNKSAAIFDAEGNPLAAVTNFWFAWFAFNPETEIFRAD